MSSDAPFRFPAPIGGFPISLDLAPSILFVVLYASLACVAIYRIRKPQSRNIVMCMAIGFLTERTVLWSLRSWTSQTPSQAHDKHTVTYFQVGFNVGYLAIWGKLIFLLRAIAVNSTKGTTNSQLAPASADELPRQSDAVNSSITPREGELGSKEKIAQTEDVVVVVQDPEIPQIEDQPHRRAAYRKLFNIVMPVMLLPFILGPVAGNWYPDAETSRSKAKTVGTLRYIVATICLMLIITYQSICVYVFFKARNIRRAPLLLLLLLACILMIIPIYQIVIMRETTTSLLSREHGSQNTPVEKVFFYVLQVVPEFTCVSTLLSVNTKTMFGTGVWGDHDQDILRVRSLFRRRRTAA